MTPDPDDGCYPGDYPGHYPGDTSGPSFSKRSFYQLKSNNLFEQLESINPFFTEMMTPIRGGLGNKGTREQGNKVLCVRQPASLGGGGSTKNM